MQADWQQHINNKHQKDYQWTTFAKGSSNTLYLGEFENENLVVRVNAPTELTPGVERQREAALLALISCYQWAPRIIENGFKQGWCAMYRYEAITEPTLSPQQSAQLLTAITELQLIDTKHLTPIVGFVVEYEKLWDTLYLPEAQKQNCQQALTWLKQIKQLLNDLPSVPACFVHHDLHLGNLAMDSGQSPNQIILLDWEYGGIGNPWIDAAALKSLLAISNEDIHQLPAFKTLSLEHFNIGLRQATHLMDIISKIWYWMREQKSA